MRPARGLRGRQAAAALLRHDRGALRRDAAAPRAPAIGHRRTDARRRPRDVGGHARRRRDRGRRRRPLRPDPARLRLHRLQRGPARAADRDALAHRTDRARRAHAGRAPHDAPPGDPAARLRDPGARLRTLAPARRGHPPLRHDLDRRRPLPRHAHLARRDPALAGYARCPLAGAGARSGRSQKDLGQGADPARRRDLDRGERTRRCERGAGARARGRPRSRGGQPRHRPHGAGGRSQPRRRRQARAFPGG